MRMDGHGKAGITIMRQLLKIALGIALVSGSAIAQESAPSHPLIPTLDAAQVTKGLRLSGRKVELSDNGRMRVSWIIQDLDKFEIIGNDQADADVVAWHCGSYDKAGNFLRPVPPDSFCGKFFTSVLANLGSSPNSVASTLLRHAHENGGDARSRIGNFSIETDGEFFFVRRLHGAKSLK